MRGVAFQQLHTRLLPQSAWLRRPHAAARATPRLPWLEPACNALAPLAVLLKVWRFESKLNTAQGIEDRRAAALPWATHRTAARADVLADADHACLHKQL